eukprot:NODE_1349_length_1459_cov_1637.406383_g855_i9.p2 GENE.NODE_1349_length_1459_cov_1637.406383_g855_i9~~NODE_1349_length_1459_cov_1637.406383_g855_i9.p2  ORF type:complete len:411 (-),score=185.14 NODE_1349_length_1459_cov_1637.406383_g855_i9:133-1365(-)
MSHRKFEHPRCGSLAFLPRKRAARMRGRVKTWPADDNTQAPHLTGFMGWKAGMTHIVRDLDRFGSRMHKKEVTEAVTILETPPIICVGLVGYIETPVGLRALKTVWAQHLSEQCRRRFYRNWSRAKNKAFTHYLKEKWGKDASSAAEDRNEPTKSLQADLANIKKHATVVRALCHTQPDKIRLGCKKANIAEIQINGGKNTAEKVDFAVSLFEQQIPVDSVFKKDGMLDTVAVNKGHGFEGVIHRWGVTKLPRKTHKGLRKVACIGAWHPARVSYSVARAGQHGCHHRTEKNKKIYKISKKGEAVKEEDKTSFSDWTDKPITPMGGFPWYGPVDNDYVMVKGSICGPRKRLITLRQSLHKPTKKWMTETTSLKFVDTSSKLGHGRFQTPEEKKKFLGPPLKKHRVAEEKE